jgi:hypothetical protein
MCQVRWILSLRGNDGKIVRRVTSVNTLTQEMKGVGCWGVVSVHQDFLAEISGQLSFQG